MKQLFILFALLVSSLSIIAVEPSVPDDEEDPYFLLCGQADKAIADGNYTEAAARLIDAMSIRPNSPENILLMSNLGMIYSYMGRDSLALATLDEAHRRAPAMRTVVSNRAKVLLKLGRDSEALRDFSSVIEADSLNTEARFYRGMISLYSGNASIAQTDFEILKSIAPKGHDTAVALSTLYSLTGRDSEAIPYLKSLISEDPSAEYFATLAGCYIATNQYSEASATISEGLAKYNSDPELYYYRAILNRDLYRLDEAHADANRAVKLGLAPQKAKDIFK